jgi:hypothetical protein
MTENELGKILKEMYDDASSGEQLVKIHLFGVKYALVICDNNYKAKDIIRASGLNPSYVAELNKGIKLAKYVMPR